MALLRDDVAALQYQALRLELKSANERLRQLRFGDVVEEVEQLNRKINVINRRIDELSETCPLVRRFAR